LGSFGNSLLLIRCSRESDHVVSPVAIPPPGASSHL
jgi:hypothetical protein